MDHERYPYYFDDAKDGHRIGTSLPEAFMAAIEVLRELFTSQPRKAR